MHMLIRAEIDGNLVMRSYIPIADDETTGHVDLLVKVYGRGVHPSFPDGGKMSQHLDSLSDGDSIEVRGPVGELVYKGHVPYNYKGVGGNCAHISRIAGRTGLTLVWQVINAVLGDANDKARVRLVYADKSPPDILLCKKLDAFEKVEQAFDEHGHCLVEGED